MNARCCVDRLESQVLTRPLEGWVGLETGVPGGDEGVRAHAGGVPRRRQRHSTLAVRAAHVRGPHVPQGTRESQASGSTFPSLGPAILAWEPSAWTAERSRCGRAVGFRSCAVPSPSRTPPIPRCTNQAWFCFEVGLGERLVQRVRATMEAAVASSNTIVQKAELEPLVKHQQMDEAACDSAAMVLRCLRDTYKARSPPPNPQNPLPWHGPYSG